MVTAGPVRLVSSPWLQRTWEVHVHGRAHRVGWSGRGLGHEAVLVDDEAPVVRSSPLWFTPRFDFVVGGAPASLEVRVWPWLRVRSLELRVDGVRLASEGPAPGPARPAASLAVFAALGAALVAAVLAFLALRAAREEESSAAGGGPTAPAPAEVPPTAPPR